MDQSSRSSAPAEPARVALNDRRLRALKPGPTAYDIWDSEQPGLLARVLPSGLIEFSTRYRFQGHRRRLKLGTFPAVTLKRARILARKAKSEIDTDHDPAAERRAAKAARTDTVDTLAQDYLTKHARKFKKSADQDARMIDVEILPRWRQRSVRDLTRRDVLALVEPIAERAPVVANRVLALVRKMLNFAVDHDWLEANPAARVKKLAPETSRDRVLAPDEIRRLWRLLSHFPKTKERPAPGRQRSQGAADDPLCPISASLAALLKVRLLTAQRGGEVGRMRWADLDLDSGWWTIPGHDTKNGELHRVPLVRDAVALIRKQIPKNENDRGEYVFMGRGGSTVLNRAKKAPAAIRDVLGFDFRGHDLRRTAATQMAAAGVPREHIGQLLNHVEGGARATRVYDRHGYDREKRLALEVWSRVLKGIMKSKRSATVSSQRVRAHPRRPSGEIVV